MNKLIVKAFIVQSIGNQWYFLELIRAMHKPFPGMGDLPGGNVEENESLLDAIKREVFEETAISIDHFEHVFAHNLIAEHVTEYVYCALLTHSSIILNPQEHTSFSWKLLKDVDNSLLHPQLKKVINAHQAKIEKVIEVLVIDNRNEL